MTATRLRECLAAVGWTQRGLADKLGLHETRVRRWARGALPIPPSVAAWLERLATVHVENPLPLAWRVEDRAEDAA